MTTRQELYDSLIERRDEQAWLVTIAKGNWKDTTICFTDGNRGAVISRVKGQLSDEAEITGVRKVE